MRTDMYKGHAGCGPSTLWQDGQQTVRVLLEQCLAWKPEQRHVSALCVRVCVCSCMDAGACTSTKRLRAVLVCNIMNITGTNFSGFLCESLVESL